MHEGVELHPIHRMDLKREHFEQGERANLASQHEILIGIKQANLDLLDVKLQERSTPGTPFYRQWLSFEEVGEIGGAAGSNEGPSDSGQDRPCLATAYVETVKV